MNQRELRIGNIVERLTNDGKHIKYEAVEKIDDAIYGVLPSSKCVPIPLTEEWLLRMGFEKEKYYTVNNGFKLSIGRNRFLTVGCAGTPNEMVFLIDVDNEENPSMVLNIIVLRNYDYDGKTYVHHIQNIAHALTGTELPIK